MNKKRNVLVAALLTVSLSLTACAADNDDGNNGGNGGDEGATTTSTLVGTTLVP